MVRVMLCVYSCACDVLHACIRVLHVCIRVCVCDLVPCVYVMCLRVLVCVRAFLCAKTTEIRVSVCF